MVCPVKRTAFFPGKCLIFSCNMFEVRAGAAACDGRELTERHGTRSLSEDSERPLRGVDSVLEVAVENEVAERSDVMEWLIEEDGAWVDFFREERTGKVW